MPDIEVSIGGRNFLVSCQPGEEHFLRSAAAQLDIEAQPVIASMGRLPEVKMLLMAGLMLADRAAAQEDEMRELRARLSALEDRPEPEPKRVEVAVIPPQVPQTFAELAARIESVAERIGEKVARLERPLKDADTPVIATLAAEDEAVAEPDAEVVADPVQPAITAADDCDGQADDDGNDVPEDSFSFDEADASEDDADGAAPR